MTGPEPSDDDAPAHEPAGGPSARELSAHTLSSGEAVLVRDVSPDDEPLLLGLLEHVTGDSRWFRFFTGGANIGTVAREEADCDGARRLGVLVLAADGVEVLGHGMCVPAGGSVAEIAFEVADGHHRQGIGGIMLEHLIGRARRSGYLELVAEVLPSNRDMLDLLASSGMELRSSIDGGIRTVRMSIEAPALDAAMPRR